MKKNLKNLKKHAAVMFVLIVMGMLDIEYVSTSCTNDCQSQAYVDLHNNQTTLFEGIVDLMVATCKECC